MVSVALDTGGVEAAAPWIDRAKTTHPALIDAAHVLDELLGIVNVPSGVWIDEDGMIVRPPEPAFPWRPRQPTEELLAQLPRDRAEQLREAAEHQDRSRALRGRAARLGQPGEQSRFALSPDESSPARARERPEQSPRGGVLRARPASAPPRATRMPPCAGSARPIA